MPTTIEELVKLAGVGRKTATLFLADAYGIPGVTVDTHVFRISHRLGWANGKNPVETEQELMRVLPKDHWNRINFQLIYHGRSICTARKVKCSECGLQAWCEKRGEKAGVGIGLCGDYADSGRETQEQLTVQNTGLGKQYVRKI